MSLAGHRYSVGWDPAKYRDRSAVIVLDVTDERPQHVVCCQTLEGRDYALQIQRVAELAASYNRADVLMDATGNAALLEQMQATGTRVEGYSFTNATKQELIDGLVLVLEQDRVTFPATLSALIAELRYYSYTLTAAGNVKLGAPERAGATDDLTTALALALKGGQRSSRAGVWLAQVGGELGF
jgi:phage FluMu gp28-like protein